MKKRNLTLLMCLIYSIITFLLIDLVGWEWLREGKLAMNVLNDPSINLLGTVQCDATDTKPWAGCSVWDAVSQTVSHPACPALSTLEHWPSPWEEGRASSPPSPSCCGRAVAASMAQLQEFPSHSAFLELHAGAGPAQHQSSSQGLLVLLWRLLWDEPQGWEGTGGPLEVGTGN